MVYMQMMMCLRVLCTRLWGDALTICERGARNLCARRVRRVVSLVRCMISDYCGVMCGVDTRTNTDTQRHTANCKVIRGHVCALRNNHSTRNIQYICVYSTIIWYMHHTGRNRAISIA